MIHQLYAINIQQFKKDEKLGMLRIVNTKNDGHVISRSEKRAKHTIIVYNAHPEQNKESM
jgi:hypothetical protein